MRLEGILIARWVSVDLSLGSIPFFGENERCAVSVPWVCVLGACTWTSAQLARRDIKAVGNCFVTYVWSATLRTRKGGRVKGSKAFMIFQASVLRACNALFVSIVKRFSETLLPVDCSIDEVSLQLSRLSSSDGVHWMLEGKNYHFIDMAFLFIWVIKDKPTG